MVQQQWRKARRRCLKPALGCFRRNSTLLGGVCRCLAEFGAFRWHLSLFGGMRRFRASPESA
eukprot:6991237-Alexandrium_andersonii.AAC.2